MCGGCVCVCVLQARRVGYRRWSVSHKPVFDGTKPCAPAKTESKAATEAASGTASQDKATGADSLVKLEADAPGLCLCCSMLVASGVTRHAWRGAMAALAACRMRLAV